MPKKLAYSCTLLILLFSTVASASDFYAYYTKVDSGREFEKHSRTSEYADIVVNIGRAGGKLVFWRGSSYLPYWETNKGKWFLKEEIPRTGDGTAERPDNVNTYSHVEIIESNSARVIIRWRYVANFDSSYNITPAGWAIEYFTVYPGGTVIRSIRTPVAAFEEWQDTKNRIVRQIELTTGGAVIRPAESQPRPRLKLTGKSGSYYEIEEFDNPRRSYVLRLKKNGVPKPLSFLPAAGARNPVVLVRNWGRANVSSIKINGKDFNDYRTAHESTFDGADLVIWFNKESKQEMSIEITPGSFSVPANKAPEVNAGPDQSKLVGSDSAGPYGFTLEGSYEDDGLGGTKVDVTWEKVSGPGKVTFTSANHLASKVDVSSDGLYVLRLTVNDGSLAGSDELNIVVDEDPGSFDSPVAWWRFNESEGNKAEDTVSGRKDTIIGRLMRAQGVVGNCLKFSEYDTQIRRDASSAPDINTSEFTVEAWVAPRCYPWNWCPVVMQKSDEAGYYFGIDAYSRFGLWICTADGWERCNTDSPSTEGMEKEEFGEYNTATGSPDAVIPLLEWSHIVGTFSSNEGVKLYLNGKLVKSCGFEGKLKSSDADLYIGRDVEKRKPIRSTRVTPKINYSFDGLMDEIKIYNTCLGAGQVQAAYNHARPKIAQPLQYKSVPKGPSDPGRFGVYHTFLSLDDDFDRRFHVGEYADKVLLFDEYDFKTVWWHGIAYYPIQYAANGIGMQHEAVETAGANGCEEALMDKQCRYAKVKVIENTDARVVVEFRSCSNDLYYNITHKQPDGWGCWSDDLWTVYPDGTVARRITLWCSEQKQWHSYEQENYVIGAGLRPVDILDLEANTVVNLDGEVSKLNWRSGWPEGEHIALGVVKTYNIKADSVPFALAIPHLHDVCNADNPDTCLEGPRRPYPNCFPWWDHWPIEQIPCDGKNPYLVNGRFSSTCTGALIMDILLPAEQKAHPLIEGTDKSVTVPFMFGMTPVDQTYARTALKLLPLAKMYNNPPEISDMVGCSNKGYNRHKHEYRIVKKSDKMFFVLAGSSDSPIVNPCFAIKNWPGLTTKADLKIDGKSQKPGPNFRQGTIVDIDGSFTLVIWLKMKSEMNVGFEVTEALHKK